VGTFNDWGYEVEEMIDAGAEALEAVGRRA